MIILLHVYKSVQVSHTRQTNNWYT